jgi:tetratricopeptide (TPR) repeat protein
MGMDKDRALQYLVEAQGYLALDMHTEALPRLRAVAATPHFPYEAATLIGEYHRDRGEHEEAVPWFEKALGVRRGDLAATIGLGWCEKRLGRVDRAVTLYQDTLQMRPDEAILHYNLACYLSLLGRSEPALLHLEKAVGLDPEFRELARAEPDLVNLREAPAFRDLTGPPARKSPERAGNDN